MEQHVFSRRRVAGGLTCAAAGAMALVLSVGSPAGATEGPQVETGRGWSASDLADRFGGQWAEAEVPMESGRHLLDDRGTPDASDDAYVDVEVDDGDISWSSDDVAIGAVEVPGGEQNQLYTWGDGRGSRHGEFDWGGHGDRGDRDWGGHGDRGGRKLTFCWKKGGGGGHNPPPTHPPTTQPPTTAPPTTAPPTTAPPTTAPPTTAPPTTEAPTTTAPSTTLPETEAMTPTTQPAGDQLPETGSTTVPLVVGALALLGIGAGAFFGRRYLQQRA